MQEYLQADLFDNKNGFILVERTNSGKVQTGLMVALDLETYDFNKGSQTLIRATEGTILDRLAPTHAGTARSSFGNAAHHGALR